MDDDEEEFIPPVKSPNDNQDAADPQPEKEAPASSPQKLRSDIASEVTFHVSG